jgi:hypothetical protein
MRTSQKVAVVFCGVTLALVTGCGLTVKQRAAVREFNGATSAFAAITSREFQHTREDVLTLNTFREQLDDAALNREKMDESFTPERVKVRLDAMMALGSYAELLQKLVDGSQADELKAAADSLITNLRNAKAFDVNDAQGGAIAKAITSVAGLWIEHQRANATRQVVRTADPAIKKLLDVVECEFDLHSSENWVAGYRAIAVTTIGRATFVEKTSTNLSLADTALSRQARAYARIATNRVDAVARNIVDAAHSLEKAQEKLLLTLESKEIGAEDVMALTAQIQDFITIYQTLSTK